MTGRSLFRRILKGYMAMALVFTLVFGACVYMGGYAGIKESFDAEISAELGKIVKSTDLSFNILKHTTEYIAGDSAVAAYLESGDAQAAGGVQRLLERCSGGLSQHGINIYISKFSSSFDRVIGLNQVTSVYDFLSAYQFGSGSSDSIKNYFKKNENSGKIFARYCTRSSSRSIGCILTIEKRTLGSSDVYIICTLDTDSIVAQMSVSDASVAIMDGQNMICNVGSNTFQTTDAINNVVKKDSSFVAGNASEIEDGIMYKSSGSDVYQWQYVLCVPAKKVTAVAWQLMFIVLAVCCLWFLIVWASAGLVVRWIYRPINETIKFLSKYNADNVYDEGVFVRQSVSGLSKQNDELKSRFEKTRSDLQAGFLKDMLFGLVDSETFAAKAEEFGFGDISGPYRVVLLQFVDYELILEMFPKENIDKIKREIEEFINDQLKDQIIYGALKIDSKTIAAISYGREVRQLRETLADMAMMVQGSFDVEITGAIGTDCDRLCDISESYNSSRDIMKNRFYVGSRNAIVTEEDVRAVNTEGFYYPLDVERELIINVIRARRDEAHRIISSIIEENFRSRTLTKDRIDAFVFAITATLNRIIDELNKTPDEIFGDGEIVFLDLKMCRDMTELERKIYEMFDAIIDCIDAENRKEEDNLADRLLDYIHSHYNEDISLMDIGGHFNLSQCYASTLFKETTGENFKDYLSRYRIKKAKEILENDPTIKNSELAKMIGCNTVATLFRLFNKYEGTSPGQYIKNLKQQGDE